MGEVMDEEQDQDGQDNEDELDALGESDADGDDAPPATDNDGSEPESKRIRDLMSNWQTEQARANRLQEQLDQLSGKRSTTKQKRPAKDDPLDEFRAFAREDARQRLFNSEPRFAEYGIEASMITGETIAEMQKSFESQRKVVDAMESKIRNKVMADHGIDAGIGGAGRGEKLPDFGSMSQKDFEALIDKRSSF